VDGYTIAFRGSKPVTELRAYFDRRRKAIEEMHPTAAWMLNCNTYSVHYEVLETYLQFSWLNFSPSCQLGDGIWARSNPIPGNEYGNFRSLFLQEIVSPDTPNGAWERKYNDLGIECCDVSFWTEGDMLMVTEAINNGYVAGIVVLRRGY
jgi:hypothetical protein